MREAIELRHMRYFVTLADELHFGRAAERLFMSQPPLSQQIKALEDELGSRLFLRSKKGLTLTPEGTAFLRRAQSILGLTRTAIDEVKQMAAGTVGTLRVSYMSAAMLSTLPPLINSLRVATGGIDIVLHQMSPDEQLPAISEGRIDIGFVDLLGQAEPLACPRRFNIDHLCRLNFDQGLELSF
jgi:DNA-binding transcriptional LysR family regulator